jgi:putative transposase
MARRHRFTPGGYVYHVFNRGSRKGVLFDSCEDHDAFLRIMERARAKRPMRITAYCLMKTHFLLLLWPKGDNDVPRFMKWLTSTHAMTFHRVNGSTGTGAVYQSRYVSKPIGDGRHFFTALRYVERNALEAGKVDRAEAWPWCSAWSGEPRGLFVADEGPFVRPPNWLEILNDS